MKRPDRSLILNAFRPGTAIDLPSHFAGRKDEIESLVDAMHVDGACPIIYGERGLGKSSLALQIERIALGDTELLDELGMGDRAFDTENQFITFQFSCTDGIVSKDDLLQRLINTAEGFTDADELPGKTLTAARKTKTLKLKFYEHQIAETFSLGGSSQKFKRLSVEEKFEIITQRILETKKRRVLYIIDELDRLRDTKGLASVIKNLSSTEVKFLLVGVGQNISALLHDHASLERALVQVHVQPMRDDDAAAIVWKAQSVLNQQELDIEFSKGAVRIVVEAAGGFPWFVHTLGQEALRCAYDEERRAIVERDVQSAINQLGTKRFGQQFYDTYQMAVRDSDQREIVLRLFAKWRDTDIPTSDIYPLANRLGVTNPSALTRQLTSAQCGRVLVRPPYAPTRSFRFTNAMFKRYVNLRGSLYAGIKEKVEDAWRSRTTQT